MGVEPRHERAAEAPALVGRAEIKAPEPDRQVAGTGGNASGLAYRILESSYQLKIPRMFAALLMISMTGIAIFLLTSWLSNLLLRRWHESAVKREN